MSAGVITRLVVLMVGLCAGPVPALAGISAGDHERPGRTGGGAGRAVPAWPGAPARAPGIHWSAPAGCPDREWLVSAIGRHQGGPLRAPAGRSAPAGFSAHVEVARRGREQWRMTLRIQGGDAAGERVVEGGSCKAIAQAAALLIALALDGAHRGLATDRVVQLEPWDLQLPPVRAPPSRRRRARAGDDGVRAEWRVRSSLAYGAMALPGRGFGVGVAAAVVRDRLRIDLSGAHWFERTGTVAGEPMAGGSFHLEAVALRGCWRVAGHLGGAVGAGCVGAEVGAIRAAGFGVDRQNAVRELWAAPMASFVGGYKLTRSLGISAIADYAWALRRPRFTVSGLGQVHQPGRSVLRLHLGVEARFH